MSNTPFFIYWDIFYCIYKNIFWRSILSAAPPMFLFRSFLLFTELLF